MRVVPKAARNSARSDGFALTTGLAPAAFSLCHSPKAACVSTVVCQVSQVRPLRESAAISQVLRAPIVQRSAHFALHATKLGIPPASRRRPVAPAEKLSTEEPAIPAQAVDKTDGAAWLACVVPKRHARRAVTRNLIKRQIREAVRQVVQESSVPNPSGSTGNDASPLRLPGGAYVMRLSRPFVVAEFPSAASEPLKQAVRRELLGLFRRAAQPR